MHTSTDQALDTRGLYCPEPIMLLHNKMRDMAVGEQVLVLATDPATQRDIRQFCRFLGHQLLREEQRDAVFSYLIKKQ